MNKRCPVLLTVDITTMYLSFSLRTSSYGIPIRCARVRPFPIIMDIAPTVLNCDLRALLPLLLLGVMIVFGALVLCLGDESRR